MESLNASEAKREFGELLIKAQYEPVGINKNGKPVAVVMSAAEYEALARLKEESLRAAIHEGLKDLDEGNIVDGESVIERLKSKVV
ncbi:type II toxin-antitoxin system Phd/YefM family antitoxin [Zooshikella ganghwensis]|uniref:type II toxin-antitoxin system Phd/YefM family antitoxin n=1 Tax=Zooshikella ganghwensis TaxID=202772 RepID=UPI00041154A8|nr:type II toxin-antitoxin system Phd/YefM family antitoxin [Zooshikella ganghwensis]